MPTGKYIHWGYIQGKPFPMTMILTYVDINFFEIVIKIYAIYLKTLCVQHFFDRHIQIVMALITYNKNLLQYFCVLI